MNRKHTLVAAASAAILACNSDSKRGASTTELGSDVRIESALSCLSCSIVIDTQVTLPNIFAFPAAGTIARDAESGAIYVVDRADNLLKAFSSEGQLVRTVGRRGGGPGEYEQVRNVLIGPHGAIHVLDGVLGRHTTFAPDGKLLSTTHIAVIPAFMNRAVLRTDGGLVVNTSNPGGSGGANTVELLDTAGRVVRGVDSAPLGPSDQWRRSRVFWKRENDELLVGQRYAPTIDVYEADFSKKGSITRIAEWFPERELQEEPSDGVFDKPVSPSLESVWEDTKGRLWLQMLAPSPAWTPRQRPARFNPETYAKLGQRPRIQTVIEVLDVQHGRVLARLRVEGGLGAALGGGFLADYMAENAVGEPEVRILRLRLNE